VGSPKVAQLAAIARRRCLPHDCHFKCAIMAAGLAKKNAILRNSSRGCLAGRPPSSLSLSLSLSLPLSLPQSRQSRARWLSAAGPFLSPSHSCLLSLSLSLSLSVSLSLSFSLSLALRRAAQGPADADRRWAFHWGLRATGRDLTVVHHSLFAFLSGSLSCLPPSSLPRSSPPFLFLQTFLRFLLAVPRAPSSSSSSSS